MSTSFILIKRNIKLFFKDKGMFFTSLITPGIADTFFKLGVYFISCLDNNSSILVDFWFFH